MINRYLILVCGRPGSGKSTLAKNIAKELRTVLIDKDCIDEPFSPDDRGPFYQENIEPKAYHALLNLAAINLELGQTVLLDAPWTHQMFRQEELAPRVLEVAKKAGAKLMVLDVNVSEETLRQRLMKRGLKRDSEKFSKEGWEAFAKRMQLGRKNPLPHFVIDGERSPEECLQQAITALQMKF